MSERDSAVTVIIPTRGLPARAGLLADAIESVANQQGVRAVPLVVLNGTRHSAEVRQGLRADPRLRLIELPDEGLPAALLAGREAVDTPWFASLDDDDELLPGALSLRIRALVRRPEYSTVITNGYRRNGSGDELHVLPGLSINHDPLRALLRKNWLLPGSWLCRTDLVGATLFEGMPRYLECTFLGIRFSTEYRMVWLDQPTVVYRLGSPLAESASREYLLGRVDALRGMLTLDLPEDVRNELRTRIASAYHEAADHKLATGAVREAWRWHRASLRETGGLRYLPFTRHLLFAAWRRSPSGS